MAQVKHTIDYAALLERAALGVVTDVLRRVQQEGSLPGRHYFYITFETTYPGVILAESLRQQYPQMMTIVLQRQFWDLEVKDDLFAVTLSFDRQPQRLHIPFASLLRFSDPSVDFNLRFRALTSDRQQLRDREEAGTSAGAAGHKGDHDVVKFPRMTRPVDGLHNRKPDPTLTTTAPPAASPRTSKASKGGRSVSHGAVGDDPTVAADGAASDGGRKVLNLDDFRTQWSGSSPLTSTGKSVPDKSAPDKSALPSNPSKPKDGGVRKSSNEDKDNEDEVDDHL